MEPFLFGPDDKMLASFFSQVMMCASLSDQGCTCLKCTRCSDFTLDLFCAALYNSTVHMP